MVRFIQDRTVKRQGGYAVNNLSAYAEGAGEISFAQDQSIFWRIKCMVPQYATIDSASIKFNLTVKTPANAQSSIHTIWKHDVADSPALVVGEQVGARDYGSLYTTWTCVWEANASGPSNDQLVYSDADVKTLLQAHVNRADYRPGMSMTFRIFCSNENGSDMGVRMNNDFLPTPRLTVNYTPNRVDDRYVDANRLANPNFDGPGPLGDEVLPGWGQNSYYGMYVGDAPNLGTITRDTSFTRIPGVPTLKFTTGTPPTENTGRSTGPAAHVVKQNELPYVFCGWIYIPSAITTEVWIGDPYLGDKLCRVDVRDQWTPFCSHPTDLGTGDGAFWPAIAIRGPWPANTSMWLSEACVLASPFRVMGFNAGTPDVVDPSGNTLIDYRGGGQTAIRDWVPRTGVVRNGTLLRVPTYRLRSEGMLENVEPIKGGPISSAASTQTVDSYPAGLTIAEL